MVRAYPPRVELLGGSVGVERVAVRVEAFRVGGKEEAKESRARVIEGGLPDAAALGVEEE